MAPDLPRGRKRPGWKAAVLQSLEKAAADLRNISDGQIAREIARNRKLRKNLPEISVVGASQKKMA
jgi:hypothetical protein